MHVEDIGWQVLRNYEKEKWQLAFCECAMPRFYSENSFLLKKKNMNKFQHIFQNFLEILYVTK